jgi:DNA invertase Pin-like site-specific DNA recombinase
MALTHAVSYLRVSGRGQVDGDGFPRQREAIQRFARANRYAIVDEFRDEGVSGTSELADRPGLAALLDRIESNGVRVVILERADRLARDLMVSEVIVNQFAQLGAKVITADTGTDLTNTDDPSRKLIRQVLAAVAEFEKAVIVLKLRAARDRVSRKQGARVEGAKPFGELPGEAETLARLLELRQSKRRGQPLSIARIAATLNAEGRATRRGGPWKPGSVFDILKRRAA